jgi:nicotinamide mononucleotide adenylyltransferase
MRLINTYMQKVVIYPGRFQPMLAHHAEVYKKLQAQFPDAKVYVGTSNKVDGEKSPFNFEEKQLIATAHGISAEAVLPQR